jgi:hypothetical protein
MTRQSVEVLQKIDNFFFLIIQNNSKFLKMKKELSYKEVYERHFQAFIDEMLEKEKQYLTDRTNQLSAINKLLEICQKEIDFQLDTSLSFADVLSRKIDSDNVQWRLEVENTVRDAVHHAGTAASTVEAIRPIMTVLNHGNDPLSMCGWRSADSSDALPLGTPERNRPSEKNALMQKIIKAIDNKPKTLTSDLVSLHPSVFPVSFYRFLTDDRDGADWQKIETYAADHLEAAILPVSPEAAAVLFSWAQYKGLVK